MNKNLGIGLVVVVVLIILGGWLIGQSSQKPPAQSISQNSPIPQASAPESSEEAMMKKKMEVMELAMKDQTSKKGELKDVSGGTSSGMAYNLRKNGKLLHTATGKLPDPPAGQFYEGWIVNKATSKLEDSGKLEKQKDGTYEVSKEFDQEFSGYDFIVITLEKVDDMKPEKHILEGIVQ